MFLKIDSDFLINMDSFVCACVLSASSKTDMHAVVFKMRDAIEVTVFSGMLEECDELLSVVSDALTKDNRSVKIYRDKYGAFLIMA